MLRVLYVSIYIREVGKLVVFPELLGPTSKLNAPKEIAAEENLLIFVIDRDFTNTNMLETQTTPLTFRLLFVIFFIFWRQFSNC